MHIKKLEISGFKSFVDKTVVHFDSDVIGIVGPNGCGKSNIVDAIRWCMGEQSAKHLRGRAMEDVIFNGSESRPPHGLAEVTLTFDNADKGYAQTLPEEYREYAEIAVTRRLFRDGTSEYLINKTAVRLRDVTDLFLGTGVGTKAYSIVEQGRIGQIVSSRPQDRRLYIEEAAGITKYKLRRKQAERKMDLTRQNLLRITDIVSEIDRNRGTLKRQAAKAERYVAYRNELEDLFLHDAAHRLLEMIVMEQAEARFLGTEREQSESVTTRLAEGEEHLRSARDEASTIEQRYDAATQLSATRDQRVTQAVSDVERAQDRINHLTDRLKSLANEQQTLSTKLEQVGSEKETLDKRVLELAQDEEALENDAVTEHTTLLDLHAQERQAEQHVSAERLRAASIGTECATLGARIEAWQQRHADAESRTRKAQEERAQLGTEIERGRLKEQALQVEVAELRESRELGASRTTDLEAELSVLKPERRETARRVETLRSELNLRRSRLRVLQELHQSLEGLGAGTKALLSGADPTVLGILADRVEVEEQFTQAFAGLLGDRLQCVIVADPHRGLELLSELREGNKGRASISPLHPLVSTEAALPSAADPRVLARLVDKLQFAAEDAGLVAALVGNAVVVASAHHALEIAAEFAGVTAVALDGTVVSAHGVVSGGSGDNVAASMLEQKREIRHLTELLAGLETELTAAVEHHADIEHRIAELESALELSRKSQHERELRHMTAEKDLARTEAELERLAQRHARVIEDLGGLEQQMAEFVQELDAHRARLQELRDAEIGARETLAAADAELQACKQRSAEQAARVTERKVRIAQVREQLESSRGSLQRLLQEEATATQRLSQVVLELADASAQEEETQGRLKSAAEVRELAEADAVAARRELETVRALLDQVRVGVGHYEGQLKELRTELSECEDRMRQHEMKLQKWGIEKAHLVQGVRERFRGLELPRVVGDYHARPAPDAEHRRRIDELGKLIDRMGPVNLDAQVEYEDAEKRFSELNAQKEDIEKALSELDRAIKQMDRESKRRFKETFDAVNDLFRATFTRLFRGGRGELRLTDPEDILETGVDIVAQPPGKKLGNIELMSGGEKALTATALIFAIFQYRPSPFCILDEVDAPLDEANVTRYNEAIRAMTANSQFIVITHIKKTMQSVDVLYGVTMGEPGVSRLVSVKVNDEAKSRSEKAPSNFVPPAPAPELVFPDVLDEESAVQVA